MKSKQGLKWSSLERILLIRWFVGDEIEIVIGGVWNSSISKSKNLANLRGSLKEELVMDYYQWTERFLGFREDLEIAWSAVSWGNSIYSGREILEYKLKNWTVRYFYVPPHTFCRLLRQLILLEQVDFPVWLLCHLPYWYDFPELFLSFTC